MKAFVNEETEKWAREIYLEQRQFFSQQERERKENTNASKIKTIQLKHRNWETHKQIFSRRGLSLDVQTPKKVNMQIHTSQCSSPPPSRGEVSGRGQALLNPDPNPSSYRRKIYKLLIKIRRGKVFGKKINILNGDIYCSFILWLIQ